MVFPVLAVHFVAENRENEYPNGKAIECPILNSFVLEDLIGCVPERILGVEFFQIAESARHPVAFRGWSRYILLLLTGWETEQLT